MSKTGLFSAVLTNIAVAPCLCSNIMKMRKPLYLLAILVLAFLLRAPGWFVRSGAPAPGEEEQVAVALSALHEWAPATYGEQALPTAPQGFGLQIAGVAYLAHFTGSKTLQAADLVLIGRILSTLYALFLIGLVYLIGLHLFHSSLAARFGALLMALFDLDVMAGHYAWPTVAHAFWSYAAVFMMIIFYQRFIGRKPEGEPGWSLALAIPFATAQAFAVQFDFLPILIAAAILLLLLSRRKFNLRSTVGYAGSFFAFFVLFFYLSTFFEFGWAEVRASFAELFRANADGIASDRHWLHHAVAYPIGITAGSSLLAVIVFAIALISLFGRGKAFPGYIELRWWLLFLFLEWGVLWAMDTAYLPRANIFLPFVAILAGRGLAGVLRGDPGRPAWQRHSSTWLVILYTAFLTLSSLSYTWTDNRELANAFLARQSPEGRTYFSPYALPQNSPAQSRSEAGMLVLHEADYQRYWRSFATPLGASPPACCAEVLHCSEADCRYYQSLLSGEHPGYQQTARFPVVEVLPERRLYQRLFGNVDPYLGEVRVFRRKGE